MRYRPQSRAEMLRFKDGHCHRCKHAPCTIEARTIHPVDDARYPEEWIEDGASPTCTKFEYRDSFLSRARKAKIFRRYLRSARSLSWIR